MPRFHLTPFRAALFTGAYVVGWVALLLVFPGESLVDVCGWIGLYAIGFAWMVYLLERATRRVEARNTAPLDVMTRPIVPVAGDIPDDRAGGWNPLDPAAHYYGFVPSCVCFLGLAIAAVVVWVLRWSPDWLPAGFDPKKLVLPAAGLTTLALLALALVATQSQRLRQTLAGLSAYSLLFALVYILAHLRSGADDQVESELPAGGGTDSIKPTAVKVQKVVRKKYVINPYSNIVFAAPPPIDQIELKLTEETANQYKAGQGPGGLGEGAGQGGGFGAGTGAGKYQLVRLRHSDKAWNKNFGIGGDRNLLVQLKVREPATQVMEEDVSIDFTGMANASAKKPYPLVYVGGSHTFSPTAAEKKILREYLLDKHGMILGDNLGGPGFHGNFIAVMNEVTGVVGVPIPRDDRIHQRPYELPQLPIVVAHGGTTPLGWKIDGRWAVYYHPGALSDAWRDDHAGIKKVIWEQCYQLGINILYYAYLEQSKWRQAQKD